VELKAVKKLLPEHEAQLINYQGDGLACRLALEFWRPIIGKAPAHRLIQIGEIGEIGEIRG
jgi:hypothetical protein